MHIIEYQYLHGTEDRNSYIAIPFLDRTRPAAYQFMQDANLCISLSRPTAFLYVDGFSISQAESGINNPKKHSYMPAIKAGSSYAMHTWIGSFENKHWLEHAEVISSTCAAGVEAVFKANQLLNTTRVEEVIIIGGERTTEDTIRLFKELRINVKCGDGFVYMKLEKGSASPNNIANPVWQYKYQDNPFFFDRETMDRLNPMYNVDYVKLHDTGTPSNTAAEEGLAGLGKVISYKSTIGHTQGVSALLETCMVLDNYAYEGTILVSANGMGGFYGAFTLIKK